MTFGRLSCARSPQRFHRKKSGPRVGDLLVFGISINHSGGLIKLNYVTQVQSLNITRRRQWWTRTPPLFRPPEALRARWRGGWHGVDGISDFNALHTREDDHEVQFCASIFSKKGGVDLGMLVRKTNLERLMARRPEGVFVNPSSASA